MNVAAQFSRFLEDAPLGAFVLDADLRIQEVNPAARSAFSAVPDLIGCDFAAIARQLWPPAYARDIVERLHHTLKTGKPLLPHSSDGDSPPHLDGLRHHWRIVRIRLEGGRRGLVCFFHDPALPTAKDAVLHSEERFSAFLAANSQLTYRLNADWSELRFLRGNALVPDTQQPTTNWLEKYIAPQDHATFLAAIRIAVQTRTPFELEHRVILLDGTLGWVFSRAVPLLDEDGQLVEWLGTAQDVTARHLAEDTLRRLTLQSEQERRLYRTILSNTPDFVYVFNLDHRFTYANESLLRMWGKTAEEAIGKNCLELGYEPWHAAKHDQEIDQVIATRQPVRGEVPFSGTQGRRIYDYIFVPVLDLNGEVEAIAGTTRDITERSQTETELRHLNQDLEQFAYAATHDLQEPVRSIKLYSELLARRYQTQLDRDGLQLLDVIRAGGARLEMLINDLLSYTRIEAAQPIAQSVDANACFASVLANLSAAIQESGARISSDPLPSLNTHATQLSLLFQNLLANAIKYRRPDTPPVIHVTCRRAANDWCFTVSDNGIGIDPAFTERIFGVFKRLHTYEQYPGTGIGLAICKRIVERGGGRIWVESKPGEGSAFHFTFPA